MAFHRSVFLALASLLVVTVSGKDPIVLKAIKEGTPVGLVIVQGAQIPADTYIPLAQQIMLRSPFALSVSIPTFALNTPEPLVLKGGIEKAEASLHAAGLPKEAPMFLAGHSLGGAMLQDYVAGCTNCAGQILMGAGLLRKYRGKKYPVNTLTIDGTLDGLYRVTRQAENYYHFNRGDSPSSNQYNFPVVVYEGVSHMQFASGPPPALVKKEDLKPEVSIEAAHNMTAGTIANFLNVQAAQLTIPGWVFGDASDSKAALEKEVQATGTLVAPIIASLEQEGFIHFKAPCNSDYPMPNCPAYPRYPGKQKGTTPQTDCTCGTPWVQTVAQKVMGGLDTVQFDVTDSIHAVSDINPIHLPKVWNTCASTSGCKLNITTVTQQVYDKLDGFDTGFSHTSAAELRVKMVSRQNAWVSAGIKNANFNQTDVSPQTCADINKLAMKWALDHAGPSALARFNKIGEPLTFGNDLGPYNAGPLWIYNPLKYEDSKTAMNIQSPMMHTPLDYGIKAAAGFHYCKLLSPARAMEWIYIDGLRTKGGL